MFDRHCGLTSWSISAVRSTCPFLLRCLASVIRFRSGIGGFSSGHGKERNGFFVFKKGQAIIIITNRGAAAGSHPRLSVATTPWVTAPAKDEATRLFGAAVELWFAVLVIDATKALKGHQGVSSFNLPALAIGNP